MNPELEEIKKTVTNIWLKLLSVLNQVVLIIGAGVVAFDQTNHAMVQAAFASLSPAKQMAAMVAFSTIVQVFISQAKKAAK